MQQMEIGTKKSPKVCFVSALVMALFPFVPSAYSLMEDGVIGFFSGSLHFLSFVAFSISPEEFLHSAQMMSQITPLEVDILFVLCHLLHQTRFVTFFGAVHD